MGKQHRKNGFSLIELMVAMAAAAIVTLILSTILITAYRCWHINNAHIDLRRDSALAFSRMTRDIRESKFSNITTKEHTLTLTANTVMIHKIIYTQKGNSLEYTNGSLKMTLIHDDVQFFGAEKDSSNQGVVLTLALAKNTPGIGLTNQVFVNTRNGQ